MLRFAAVTAAALAVVLAAEWRGRRAWVWIAKPVASAAFVAAALALDAPATVYGRWLLLGLVLSALGDVLLLVPGARGPFLAGLGSFLLAHLAYAAAFASRGLAPAALLGAAVLMAAVGLATLRWLRPHLRGAMRAAVPAYVLAIGAMVACAAGASAAPGGGRALLGAVAFAASDLAVARERFVASTPWNRTWGLPLYYAGQLLLVWSLV